MRHTLVLTNGEAVDYQLERRQRRTLGLKITAEGLVIHAPMRVSQRLIEDLIKQKSDWVLKKLTALQSKQVAPFAWQHGDKLWLLGNEVTLTVQIEPRVKAVRYDAGLVQIGLPNIDDKTVISHKIIQWYKKEALADFARRLSVHSAKLGVNTPKLLLSNAKSRWGSCNSKKEVRLNWRLLQAPPHIINYVICHELAHLKEMNHSAKFWAVVASIYPDYKQAEKDLKTWSPTLHII